MGVFPFVHPSRRWLHADVRNGIVKRVPRIAVGGRRVLWTIIVRWSTCSPLRLRCSMVGVLSSMCELSLPCNQPYFIISSQQSEICVYLYVQCIHVKRTPRARPLPPAAASAPLPPPPASGPAPSPSSPSSPSSAELLSSDS